MTTNAKRVFDDFNPKLVRVLPLQDPYFLAALTKQHLFSGNLKEKVMAAPTEADATTKFLYAAIERSLNVNNREPFDRLLLVMEEFGDLTLSQLCEDIKKNLSVNDNTTTNNCKDSEPSQPDTLTSAG